jgi:hypothetical protein
MAMNRLARSLAPLTIACCQLANVVGDAPQNTVSAQSPAAVPLTWEFAVGAPDEHLVVTADVDRVFDRVAISRPREETRGR